MIWRPGLQSHPRRLGDRRGSRGPTDGRPRARPSRLEDVASASFWQCRVNRTDRQPDSALAGISRMSCRQQRVGTIVSATEAAARSAIRDGAINCIGRSTHPGQQRTDLPRRDPHPELPRHASSQFIIGQILAEETNEIIGMVSLENHMVPWASNHNTREGLLSLLVQMDRIDLSRGSSQRTPTILR